MAHGSRRQSPLPAAGLRDETKELVDVQAAQPRESFENKDGNSPVPDFVGKYRLLRTPSARASSACVIPRDLRSCVTRLPSAAK